VTSEPAGAPVAVGALGGSGTRAVAQVLQGLGVDLGADLNGALDDLLFTLLFKQPRWLDRTDDGGVARRLDLYQRLRTGGPTGIGDLAALSRAVPGFDPALGRRVGLERAIRAWRGRRRAAPPRWGWKEPNTHVLLDHLIARWPDLRYVHVVRHGLDMAWSSNTQQLSTWAPRFGVTVPVDADDGPRSQLAWWLATTERAIALGERLGDRFLLLDYDTMCQDPEGAVRRLADLVGSPVDAQGTRQLAALVEPPATVGRWRQHGTDAFGPEQLERVAALGYPI
jgi:hypothetical protein